MQARRRCGQPAGTVQLRADDPRPRVPPIASMTAGGLLLHEARRRGGLPDAQYAMSQIVRQRRGRHREGRCRARGAGCCWPRSRISTRRRSTSATWLVDGIGGGPRDMKAGFGWMMRAAQGGNVAAQNRLAKLYRRRASAFEPDGIEAAAWYFIARRVGLVDPEMEDLSRRPDRRREVEGNRRRASCGDILRRSHG
jgi:hypothetical protein